MDFNCDMGEGIGNDAALMPYITSANIACGFHAGDEATIETTIILAKKYGVSIGAHISYNDKKNFGRTEMQLTSSEIYELVTVQLRLFLNIAKLLHAPVTHVKPHGALYNMSAKDQAIAATIANAVKDFDPNLHLFGLSNSYSISEAKKIGLRGVNEVFADRTYQDDGSLTPRKESNALIHDESELSIQVENFIQKQSVVSVNGKVIPVVAETMCIHGDGDHAITFAQTISQLLHSQK